VRLWLLSGILWMLLAPMLAVPDTDFFALFRYACWALFVHLPLGMIAAAVGAREPRYLAFAVPSVLVGIDAFWIEPHALEIRHYTVATPKLVAPLRIGVLSDLQTDGVGAYERAAIARLMAEKPDIVLFPGDYVQAPSARRPAIMATLRRALAGVAPPYGAYAVRGNVEQDDWEQIFAGTGVRTFEHTTALTAGPIDLVALSFADGFTAERVAMPGDRFKVAFGHSPDFALGEVDADLLVAGHTHGGQVVLPFFGPPLTLSRLPRALAAGGMHELAPGQWLVVSRGVGMERRNAPRLRFLCHPELVVIDLVPGGA
jgi:predicted MPP superfamily phosphohydrolase